jgi:O-antigen/teichoic acid export membrane protein
MRLGILFNAIWMSSEKIVALIGSLLVGIYVARYLGPTNYGKINYAISVFAIIQALAMLGADSLIFKQVGRNTKSGIRLIFATKKIRIFTFSIFVIPFLIYMYFHSDKLVYCYIIASALSGLFSCQDIYSIYFDALMKSKYNTIINVSGIILTQIIRMLMVLASANAIWFSIPLVINTAFPFFIRRIKFMNEAVIKEVRAKSISKRNYRRYYRYMLYAGLPLAFSTVAVTIYLKIAQIMLQHLVSSTSVGIYSAAITLSNGWLFVPTAMILSFFSMVYQERNPILQERKVAQIYVIVVVFNALVCTTMFFLADWLIPTLYGQAYIESAKVLKAVIWSTVFSSMGYIGYRAIIMRSGYFFLSIKMIISCILSIITGYFLIKNYGVMGAAYNIVLVEMISATFLDYFYKRGFILKIHSKCLFELHSAFSMICEKFYLK